MKKILKKSMLVVITFLMYVSLVQAQISENRELGNFSKISVSGGIDLVIEQGNNFKVVAEAKNKDLLQSIITKIEGNTLKIYSRDMFIINGNRVVYVTLKDIEDIHASGGSDVTTTSGITAGILKIVASGGSDIKMDIKAKELSCKVSGGSDAYLTGSAENLQVWASGGSDIKADGFEAGICNAEASGGSDIYIKALEELTVDASGGSDVYYSGNPRISNINTGGGSDLHKR